MPTQKRPCAGCDDDDYEDHNDDHMLKAMMMFMMMTAAASAACRAGRARPVPGIMAHPKCS